MEVNRFAELQDLPRKGLITVIWRYDDNIIVSDYCNGKYCGKLEFFNAKNYDALLHRKFQRKVWIKACDETYIKLALRCAKINQKYAGNPAAIKEAINAGEFSNLLYEDVLQFV